MVDTIDTSSIDIFSEFLNFWKDFYFAYLLPNAFVIFLIIALAIVIILIFVFLGNLFKSMGR